jgi:hypothetical protein
MEPGQIRDEFLRASCAVTSFGVASNLWEWSAVSPAAACDPGLSDFQAGLAALFRHPLFCTALPLIHRLYKIAVPEANAHRQSCRICALCHIFLQNLPFTVK